MFYNSSRKLVAEKGRTIAGKNLTVLIFLRDVENFGTRTVVEYCTQSLVSCLSGILENSSAEGYADNGGQAQEAS